MAVLKQSTTYTRMFLLVQSSDHLTGLTGATAAVTLSKAGGSFASAGGTITEVANGFYKIALTTTDTNTLGDLAFHITATSADPTDFVDQVTANILGDTLPANVTQAGGVALSTHASGMIPADLRDIAGAAVSTSTAQLGVNVVTNGDKTGYSLSQTFPTNFSALAITAGGAVTAGTVSDKTGYSLTQTFPTNFSALGITAGGHVSNVDTVTDLTSTTYAESSAVPAATATLKDKIVWLATLARNKITQTSTTQTLRNDGDTLSIATSTDSDDGTTYTRGKWA